MSQYSPTQLRRIWDEGYEMSGLDPALWRRDKYGSIMCFSQYGKETVYGWEVDHIYPESKGGSDAYFNLQPLYWRNNRMKGNKINYY